MDVASTPTVLGPLVKLALGSERFQSHGKYDVGYWANTTLSRQYRKPFVVPETV